MYANPSAIRFKRINLSLSPAESRLIEAVSEINGMQPSTFVRELVMEQLRLMGVHEANSADVPSEKRAAV